MGAWQEGSKDLHDLLDLLADHKDLVTRWQCLAWPEVAKHQKTSMLKSCRDIAAFCQQRQQEPVQGVFWGRGPQEGGKEEGAEGGTEAAGGEESSLASPRPVVQGRGVMRGEFVYKLMCEPLF